MARLKMNTNVEVIDEDICNGCKEFRFKQIRRKRMDAYGIEVEETIYQCANKELCERLLEHISEEKFLQKE